LRQAADVADRFLHQFAGIGDFAAGSRGCTLGFARGTIDLAIARHHGLCRPLQFLELGGLLRHAAGDFIQMAGDVGDFGTQTANARCKRADQLSAIDGRRVGFGLHGVGGV